MISKYLLGFIILLLLNVATFAANEFCFTLCGKNSCNGIAYDKCNSCRTPGWSKDPSFTGSDYPCVTAIYEPLSIDQKYQPIGVTTNVDYDMQENFSVSDLLVQPALILRDCGPYKYWGDLDRTSTVVITHPGVTDPKYFYKIRIWFSVITIDRIDGGTKVDVKFLINTTSTLDSIALSDKDQEQQVCGSTGGNDKQKYMVGNISYTWSNPAQMKFQLKMSGNSRNNSWGIVNFIVQARLCHIYCTVCTGDQDYVCSECNYVLYMARLSGKYCNLVCNSTYGIDTANPSICIKCQANCTSCLDAATKCISCSPTYFLYDIGATASCIKPCPTGYFGNDTGVIDVCQPCNTSCLTCSIKPDNCTSCIFGILFLHDGFCHNPCPNKTFKNTLTNTCSDCYNRCSLCSINSTYCSECQYNGSFIAYLLGNTCMIDCGVGYFQESYAGLGPNQCIGCLPQCVTCNFNESFCFSCNPEFYYFQNACGPTCTDPNYFPDNKTWTCLDCNTYCVKMTMLAYFKTSLKDEMVCDLTFTQNLTWGPTEIQSFISISIDDPLLTLSSFDIVYEVFAPRKMRISLTPKNYIFIYNVTFTFTTKPFSGTYDYAANDYKFSDSVYSVSQSLVWFLIKAPSLSALQKDITEGVSILSEKILSITTLPYIQQIKKTGIFALIMGGAQVTSTACLINTIPSQNFYEGVRLWASFIFFDVPAWQQNSKKTKYMVVPDVKTLIKDARLLESTKDQPQAASSLHYSKEQTGLIQSHEEAGSRIRKLFDTSTIEWRFQRTGHTSFFIFDAYMNIIMVALCWIFVLIGNTCIKNKIQHKRAMGFFYSFTLKIHQITIFYISLTTLMQWIYFDSASLQRWISLGMCLLFNAYFLSYELYIYRQMISYPSAHIGNQKYEYFCLKYGSLLKNIRFEEYDPKQQWSVRHWFRPYNYHVLSYYKKFLMMISLPIFYGTKNWQIYILMAIQLFQMLRFLVVWPFKSKVRSFIRFGLELALLAFFVTILIQSYTMEQITQGDAATVQSAINFFYMTGWVGFCMVFIFNIGFICFFIFDLVTGCRRSNRQMMDEARKFYYMQRLNTYEEENQDVPLALVNKWVKLGNLNDRKYDLLPDLNLRIQYYRIMKCAKGYEIDMKNLFEIFMNIEFNYQKENNLSAGKKMNKRFTLTKSLSPAFYKIIDDLYQKYSSTMQFQYLALKTFQRVVQSDHKPGDKITLKPIVMLQKIQLETYAGQKKSIKLNNLLPGFPIPQKDLKQFI